MTDDQLLAYCAGFFDGEGTVIIGRQIKKTRWRYGVQISASQKEQSPLVLLKGMFGGVIRLVNRRGIRICYLWEIMRKQDQVQFLERITPFLHCKKAEAEIALRFLQTVRPFRTGNMAPMSEEEILCRRQLFEQSKRVRRLRSLMEDNRGQFELGSALRI